MEPPPPPPWARNITIHQIISDDGRETYVFVVSQVFGTMIAIFGIFTNAIVIIVFLKQGFADTVNLSLFSLGISDLGSLITLLWYNVCMMKPFIDLDLPFFPPDVGRMTGFMPHLSFTQTTSWLTVYIAVERCLCVAAPFKVKSILTRGRIKVIIVFIFLYTLVNMFPSLLSCDYVWVFSPPRNRTIFRIFMTDRLSHVQEVIIPINNALFIVTITAIVVSTGILVVELNQKRKWRNKSAHSGGSTVGEKEGGNSGNSKEVRVVKMVVFICVFYLVCYLPGFCFALFTMTGVDVRTDMRLRNVLQVFTSSTFLLESINSSVNIFIYATLSSKFKRTLARLLCASVRERMDMSFFSTSMTKSKISTSSARAEDSGYQN